MYQSVFSLYSGKGYWTDWATVNLWKLVSRVSPKVWSAGRNSFRFPGSRFKSVIMRAWVSRFFLECRNLTHARPCEGLSALARWSQLVGGLGKRAETALGPTHNWSSSHLMIVGGDTALFGFPVGLHTSARSRPNHPPSLAPRGS